jgi:hypothetical protein
MSEINRRKNRINWAIAILSFFLLTSLISVIISSITLQHFVNTFPWEENHWDHQWTIGE